jgi:hypothetical protein
VHKRANMPQSCVTARLQKQLHLRLHSGHERRLSTYQRRLAGDWLRGNHPISATAITPVLPAIATSPITAGVAAAVPGHAPPKRVTPAARPLSGSAVASIAAVVVVVAPSAPIITARR